MASEGGFSKSKEFIIWWIEKSGWVTDSLPIEDQLCGAEFNLAWEAWKESSKQCDESWKDSFFR